LAQREVRGPEGDRRRVAFRNVTRQVSIETTVITGVDKVPALFWPGGWENAEVVDGVIVEEPPPAPPGPAGGTYNRFGRVLHAERCGRLVSVLA
jgi:hypothetical protein